MIKTIIQSTPKCADLLRYLRKNIDAINDAGYELSIEIASSERIEMLANNNINRLPVMIAPDKSLVVGVNEIINLIEKNITGDGQNQISPKAGKQRRGGKMPRTSRSVEDYFHDTIYDGVEITDRGLVAKQEQEYAEDDHFDYDKEKKKMSKHSMKHRSPLHDESDDDEPQKKPAKKPVPVPKRLPPKRQPEYDSDEDNVDGGYDNEPLENYAQDTGDLDSKMMNALLNNM